MNCVKGYVEAHKLATVPVTIMDVFDEYALSNSVREELYKCYPQAKLAHLKSGGNFPYLSRCSDVNLHILVSKFSPNFSLRLLNTCVRESYSFLDSSQAV